MTLKWTCDAHGNWRQVMREVVLINGRLVEQTVEKRIAA